MIDGGADGIEQGGGGAGDEVVGVEFGDLVDGARLVVDLNDVVEEGDGEVGGAFGLTVAADEVIGGGDGGLDAGAHGAGAVEDKSDGGVGILHDCGWF